MLKKLKSVLQNLNLNLKLTINNMETMQENLAIRYENLKKVNSNLRIREAAKQLNVSEVELLALRCGNGVTRLKPEFSAILGEIESLGYVMALSRNEEMVHERKGIYLNGDFSNPHASLFVGADIDLRIFLGSWKSAFAVTEMNQEKPRYSLQFFAKNGEAVHKIYMDVKSDLTAYNALVEKYKSENQESSEEVDKTIKDPVIEKPDTEINVAGFQEAWLNLKDTHDFFGMLRKFEVTRTQALRLAPEEFYAQKIDNLGLRRVLNLASNRQVSIMVFVGNQGIIQIHTGEVKNIVEHGPWINVLDPAFNLHANETKITETWIVRKPTEDGIVTSLELFNDNGELICTLFGARKPGIPELESWRKIIEDCNI
jgi:putative hemin transport protein